MLRFPALDGPTGLACILRSLLTCPNHWTHASSPVSADRGII